MSLNLILDLVADRGVKGFQLSFIWFPLPFLVPEVHKDSVCPLVVR